MKTTSLKTNHQKPTAKPAIFAHRGGWDAGKGKENSLRAFRAAYKLGIRHFETDVISSADGEVVAFHGSQNAYMNKKTGLATRRRAQSLNYRQMTALISPGGEKVPLLRDLLREFADVTWSIDAKTSDVVRPLVKVIKEENAEKNVIVTSFRLRRSLTLKTQLGPQVRVSICLYSPIAFLMKYAPKGSFRYLAKKGLDTAQLPYMQIDARMISCAKRSGLKIFAWSVNDPEEIIRLCRLGVDGIISDDVRLAQKAISSL